MEREKEKKSQEEETMVFEHKEKKMEQKGIEKIL